MFVWQLTASARLERCTLTSVHFIFLENIFFCNPLGSGGVIIARLLVTCCIAWLGISVELRSKFDKLCCIFSVTFLLCFFLVFYS